MRTLVLRTATLWILAVSCSSLVSLPGFSDLWTSAGQDELTESEKIIHVLHRLGFGPRPGDFSKVKARGLQAYIEEQLHPEALPDSAVKERLASFETLTKSPAQLAELLPSPNRGQAKRRRGNSPGERSDAQPEMDSMEEERRAEQRKESRKALRQVQLELSQAKIIRATYSERQLQELMVDFWMNHFNIFMAKGLDRIFTNDFEQNVIRPRVLGKFDDLLMATAKSPAMLFYLDNWISSAPAQVMEIRVRELKKRLRHFRRNRRGDDDHSGRRPEALSGAEARLAAAMQVLRRAKGLNENFARELMELHTLGVDGGYGQEDVVQVARCLTGWSISAPRYGGAFRFHALLHEEGDKVVLGRSVKSGGVEEGEKVIRILSHHPSTARFISSKLVRRFVADDPPEDVVDAASRTFERTGGDIRQVLRTIFTHPQFFSRQTYQAKIKKPLELIVSSLRAVDARIEESPHLLKMLSDMGEAVYLCPEPTGYPDVASAWVNTNSLLKRLNFAVALAANRIPGVRVNLNSAERLFNEIGLPKPNANQAQKTLSLLEALSQAERSGRTGATNRVIASAFGLGSPQFQKR